MLAVVKGGSKTVLRLTYETKRRIDRREGRCAAALLRKNTNTRGGSLHEDVTARDTAVLRQGTRKSLSSRFFLPRIECGSSAKVSASGENEAEEIYHELSARRRSMWVRGDCAKMFYAATGRKSSNPCSWLSIWLVSLVNLRR